MRHALLDCHWCSWIMQTLNADANAMASPSMLHLVWCASHNARRSREPGEQAGKSPAHSNASPSRLSIGWLKTIVALRDEEFEAHHHNVMHQPKQAPDVSPPVPGRLLASQEHETRTGMSHLFPEPPQPARYVR